LGLKTGRSGESQRKLLFSLLKGESKSLAAVGAMFHTYTVVILNLFFKIPPTSGDYLGDPSCDGRDGHTQSLMKNPKSGSFFKSFWTARFERREISNKLVIRIPVCYLLPSGPSVG